MSSVAADSLGSAQHPVKNFAHSMHKMDKMFKIMQNELHELHELHELRDRRELHALHAQDVQRVQTRKIHAQGRIESAGSSAQPLSRSVAGGTGHNRFSSDHGLDASHAGESPAQGGKSLQQRQDQK